MRIVVLGGCFWGAEYVLRDIPGIRTQVGYAGAGAGAGEEAPNYYNLDITGHAEAVEVMIPSLSALRAVIEKSLEHSGSDPSPASSTRYRRAVLCENEKDAVGVKALIKELGGDIRVEVGADFHAAEAYHQGYFSRIYGD